jgi:hypothetical protein
MDVLIASECEARGYVPTPFENIFSIARGRDLIHECKHETNSFRVRQIHFA